jgi:hypothetical protein
MFTHYAPLIAENQRRGEMSQGRDEAEEAQARDKACTPVGSEEREGE